MIQESSSVMHRDSDLLRFPTCTECVISLYQDSGYGYYNTDYSVANHENSFMLSDYLWRKYYSELATEFSKSIQTYTTPYRSTQDFRSSSFQQQLTSEMQLKDISLPNENKMDYTKNDKQIWRPFSPSPSVLDSPCLPVISKETEIEKLMRKDVGTIPYITPSKVKIEPSLSSVFTPVKKKTHKCSYCSSVFSSNVQLSNHVRIHRGYKAYICDYPGCSKSFTRNEELTRHRRIHSGYKPHLCTVCGKTFGRKDHLSKHLKTHLQVSEKKVYVCGVAGCGHRYTRSDALTRHKSTAHAIRKIKNI